MKRFIWVLVVIGAINWGLVGLGGYLNSNLNAVNWLLGARPQVEWAFYILIGLAGVKMLFMKYK